MSALRRAGTVLRSVYRLLVESQPLADLRGQAGHEMILRPRSRFANRNANPDLEAPADTNGDDVYELTDAASGGSPRTQALSVTVTDVAEQPPVITSNGGGDTAALSVPENPGAGPEGVRPNRPSVVAPPTCAVTETATTWARVHPQRPRARARNRRDRRGERSGLWMGLHCGTGSRSYCDRRGYALPAVVRTGPALA